MIKGLNHVAIAVNKLDEALDVFDHQLGWKLEKTRVVEQQKIKAALLRMGDSKIELLEPTGADSTVAKFLEKRGEGIHHIAVTVSDIEGHIEELKEKGIALIDEKPRVGMEGGKIAFIHPKSTRNVLIELVEP